MTIEKKQADRYIGYIPSESFNKPEPFLSVEDWQASLRVPSPPVTAKEKEALIVASIDARERALNPR